MKDKPTKILAIETSCDETSIAIVKGEGNLKNPRVIIIKNEILSQIQIHKEYGGVVPFLASREHERNLIPVLYRALELNYANSKLQNPNYKKITKSKIQKINGLFERYPNLLKEFKEKILPLEKPDFDLLAVTHKPGLEPALWVGINFAKALHILWDIPLLGVDHIEGHICANLLMQAGAKLKIKNQKLKIIEFPALALTISGGHTQLVLIKKWLNYKLLGETLDDATGEAFDKTARLLNLSYPGGPEIQKIAKMGNPNAFNFPRPLINSKDYNFSFSGLKTSILYTVQKMTKTELKKNIANLAASFQRAVVEVLVKKTIRAAKEYEVKQVLLAGGVSANKALRNELTIALKKEGLELSMPELILCTDNAAMIGAAAYLHFKNDETSNWKTLKAVSKN